MAKQMADDEQIFKQMADLMEELTDEQNATIASFLNLIQDQLSGHRKRIELSLTEIQKAKKEITASIENQRKLLQEEDLLQEELHEQMQVLLQDLLQDQTQIDKKLLTSKKLLTGPWTK